MCDFARNVPLSFGPLNSQVPPHPRVRWGRNIAKQLNAPSEKPIQSPRTSPDIKARRTSPSDVPAFRSLALQALYSYVIQQDLNGRVVKWLASLLTRWYILPICPQTTFDRSASRGYLSKFSLDAPLTSFTGIVRGRLTHTVECRFWPIKDLRLHCDQYRHRERIPTLSPLSRSFRAWLILFRHH